jgi:hypothetical protein
MGIFQKPITIQNFWTVNISPTSEVCMFAMLVLLMAEH